MQKILSPKSLFASLLASLIFLTTLTPAFAVVNTKSTDTPRVPGKVLVKFRDGTSSATIKSELLNQNAKISKEIARTGTIIVNVPDQNISQVIASLKSNPKVEYAEVDAIATVMDYPQTSPNDEFYSQNQWGLENTGQLIAGSTGTIDADIDVQAAWNVTTGANDANPGGVKIAVLDTGIDASHPDLLNKVIDEQNFSTAANADDFFGHGTHVSGIIAANTNNATGVAGVCPSCTLMNIKVLGDNGSGSYSGIALGIIYAADHGAKVINMSLGGTARSTTLENAVNYAWTKGVIVVAAAGNSGNQQKSYPGSYTNVISVASTNNKDKKSKFSTYGSWVDVAAPGENIYSTLPTHTSLMGSNYGFASGTSMATPMTAGTAGLIWASSRGTSNLSVRARLESTSDRLSSLRGYVLNGRINSGRALSP